MPTGSPGVNRGALAQHLAKPFRPCSLISSIVGVAGDHIGKPRLAAHSGARNHPWSEHVPASVHRPEQCKHHRGSRGGTALAQAVQAAAEEQGGQAIGEEEDHGQREGIGRQRQRRGSVSAGRRVTAAGSPAMGFSASPVRVMLRARSCWPRR